MFAFILSKGKLPNGQDMSGKSWGICSTNACGPTLSLSSAETQSK